MVTVNGYNISLFQRCKRPYVISQTHTFNKWYPPTLLGMCLRHAIFEMSSGVAVEQATQSAINYFIAQVRSPGLDITGVNTYEYAMDYCSIIRNLLEYLSRVPLLKLHHVKPLQLSNNVQWSFLSHTDETGVLHRWDFVDYVPEDVVPELHSWEVFGDVAANDSPMVLHMVSIGRRKGSHQDSPWARIFGHPRLGKIYRFKKKSGDPEGEWKPVYFAGNSDNKSKDWVDSMVKENVIVGLIKHVSVKQVSAKHIDIFRHDVLEEAKAMGRVDGVDPRSIPLSRYACDKPFTCPHQFYCYNVDLTLDSAGIYTERKRKALQEV